MKTSATTPCVNFISFHWGVIDTIKAARYGVSCRTTDLMPITWLLESY